MFVYEKKLQYPVKIANVNPQLASIIISQYGGPDGELGASLRYLSQRYSMPYPELKGLLTDIGTEELGHLEMVGTIVHQLTRRLSEEQMREGGFDAYFVDHAARRRQYYPFLSRICSRKEPAHCPPFETIQTVHSYSVLPVPKVPVQYGCQSYIGSPQNLCLRIWLFP